MGWKIGVVAGVLVMGAIFGSLVAVTMSGAGKPATANAASPAAQEAKSGFQQAFDSSFKNSCRQAAMRNGSITQAVADSYCDCALSVFKETHSTANIIQTCRQRLGR